MVYVKVDWRWVGVDLVIMSIEIIMVVFGGVMVVLVCWDLVRKNVVRGNLVSEYIFGEVEVRKGGLLMGDIVIIFVMVELYGGYMIFMLEWLSGSVNLDMSNFMYKWIFLVFFNVSCLMVMLWGGGC